MISEVDRFWLRSLAGAQLERRFPPNAGGMVACCLKPAARQASHAPSRK
jgi:hypothetical protein